MTKLRASVVYVVVVVVGATSACGLGGALAQSEPFAPLRPDVARGCCVCLDFFQPRGSESCDPDVDGGVASNSCLCGGDKDTCTTALLDGGTVVVVGNCVQTNGICGAACEGVLTFDAAP